jgi:hypothetical protein
MTFHLTKLNRQHCVIRGILTNYKRFSSGIKLVCKTGRILLSSFLISVLIIESNSIKADWNNLFLQLTCRL